MFIVIALDLDHKTFLVHIVALNISFDTEVHSLKKAQIAHLKGDKVSIKVYSKYTNFINVFLLKLAI